MASGVVAFRCTRGEDEILGAITASITPRENVDSILSSIAPRKQPRQYVAAIPPTVQQGEELLVVSFDGSSRIKRGGGACSAIVWKLPEWIVVTAESNYLPDLTVNEAEYLGLLLVFDLLSSLGRGRLIVCADSNLVIRQMRGEIECKAPGLTPLRERALDQLRSWPSHEVLKREWNQSADRLASNGLHQQAGTVITSEAEREDLIVLNRLPELLLLKDETPTVCGAAATRSLTRLVSSPEVLQSDIVQRVRIDRIRQAQDEEKWIGDIKTYLRGDLEELSGGKGCSCGKIADDFED